MKPNILDTIVAQKELEIQRLPAGRITAKRLNQAVRARGELRDFRDALASCASPPALIAEIKKASPSAGLICPNFDPVRIALEYQAGGASCLSVLTDQKFFQGSLEHLRQVRRSVNLPLLRKDFIIDPRQILESIEWGADAILLIAAILSDAQLAEFSALAKEAALTALVEVHDETELDRALSAGADLIGVNNRDLKTLQVDLATTERLARKIPPSKASDILLVAESGIRTRADVERLRAARAQAILVGESLMRGGHTRISELLERP